MFHLGIKNNLSVIQKITLSGILIALVTILQKVVAINYIPVIPFLRISFGGCALIIFASFLLGPIYGLIIGAMSDVLGYFIFDPKTMGFFPQITAIYAFLGFFSYFVFALIKFIKSKKVMAIVEYGSLSVLFILLSLFVILNDEMQLYSSTYTFELWQKICIPIILFSFLIILFIYNLFINRYFSKKDKLKILNVYQISFSCFIVEVIVMILFGTIMKGSAFGFETYFAILICQIVVAFFNIPLNTFLISYMMVLTRKYYYEEEKK